MEEAFTHAKLDFLSGGGEMGERIRNFDWNQTPLGNPETWESSLKTCVRIMLTSQQPMFVWWGDELINIYNDAYRHVLGDKHPAMLGVAGNIVWKEIWEELWTRGKTVFEKNEGTFDDALLLILNRYGYEEETYFKFSYNPIPGTKKTTEGLFCVCNEETRRILNERALDTLRKLGAIVFTEKSLDIIYRNVAEAFATNNKDFPFALVYKINRDARLDDVPGQANIVTVAASAGIDKTQHVFPESIDITNPSAITKDFCEAFRENKIVVSEIKPADITLPTGAWKTPPTQFIYLPVSSAGGKHPYCIITAALNPYRTFDETYRQFCQLIGDRISIEINKMLALEIESKRAEALAEIDRAKIVFFSNISHEFRTPLTLMLSPLEEILNQKNSNLNKSEKNNIEIAQRNSMRLLKLVNTLLDFSNIEKGKQEANFSLVDIVSLTKNLAANFRAVIEKAGMKLVVKAGSIVQPVYVDKQMWEKIVFNLLSNAFKYTLKGKITVALSAEKDYAVLKVKDTGVGIPENELPKMFESFHRIQNVAGRTFEGTGIGLSLVKELVQMHHGEISVDSVLNTGSVFTVKIPFGKEHVNEQQVLQTGMDENGITPGIYVTEIETLLEPENKEALQIAALNEKNHSPIILIVDDNADMREHLSSILSGDFNVITANNGMDALHKMKETMPALVLADIMMPVMDGFGLLKEIKSNKATENIPVIFLTSRTGEESRIKGWETGADDYLEKPFSRKELLSRVNAQIKMYKLRQSLQDNMRNLLFQAPAGICVLRGKLHVYELANDMYLKVVGNRDIVGKPVREALPELDGQGFYELLDSVYATGKPFIGNDIPVKLDTGNGKTAEIYFNFVYQPIRNPDGEIDGIFVYGVDVTEQVLSRRKIEKIAIENSKFAAIVNYSKDAIISKSLEGIIQSWNPGAEKIFGYTAAEMIGQSITKIIPPDRLNEEQQIIEQICREKLVEHFETKRLTKEGRLLDISLTISPIKDSGGKIIGASKIARDITEQNESRKRIEENEQFLELIINSSPSLIFYLDKEMRYHTTNNAFKQWFNAERKDVIGKTMEEFLGNKAWQVIKPYLLAAYQGEIIEYETEIDYRTGGRKWIHPIYTPHKNEKGEVIGLVVIVNDITQQKHAEQKNQESDQRLRLATQTSGVGIWEWDVITNKIRWDEQMFHIYGLRPTEGGFLEYSTWRNAVVPEDLAKQEKILQDTVRNAGSSQRFFKIVRANDGMLCDIEAIETARTNALGETEWIVGTNMDITDRNRSIEKITESEKQFSTLANNIQNLAWIATGDGWIYWYNQRWYDYTGTTLEEMQGWGWEKVHHPEHVKRIVHFAKLAWTKNEPWELTFPLLGKDGKYRRFLTRAFPVSDAEGNILSWVGTNTDIEEQKTISEELEEKVNERTRQLNEVNENLEQKNAALQNMNKELEAFTYISSHDLQEPLRIIQIFAGRIIAAEKEHLSETGKNYFKRMNDAAERMRALIQDLLSFSRISTSERKFEFTDLNKIVDEVKEEIREQVEEKNAIIEAADLCKVNVISFQFRQLIHNLISNSLKFSKPGVPSHIIIKSVLVTGSELNAEIHLPETNYCHISVADNGIGFEKQFSERIFQVFQRLYGKDEYAGTGIGLAIVKKIVENHNGIITAESELGKGATFNIYLPV